MGSRNWDVGPFQVGMSEGERIAKGGLDREAEEIADPSDVTAVTASDEAAFAVFRGAVDMAAVIDDERGPYVYDADFAEYIDRGRAQAAVRRTGGRDRRGGAGAVSRRLGDELGRRRGRG